MADQAPTIPTPPAPTRAQIDSLQSVMATMPQEQAALEPWNTFGPGFYARTIALPRGTVLVGKVHATEHIFILSKGELAVATEDGVQVIRAPFQSLGRPGLKRVGVALTDCVCTNVHINPDDERDLERLEARYITPEAALQAPASVEALR
jgi:hypothetical protein